MRQHDADRLESELRWTREALAVVEAQNDGFFGHKYLAAQEECLPRQYQYLAELEQNILEARVERLERDLKHVKKGEWE